MRRVALRLIQCFCRDERGAVLLLVTLFMVPIIGVVAVAVDLSRVLVVKEKLRNAIDSAAIAVGRHPELSETDANSLATSFINAHYPAADFGDIINVAVAADENQVDITATGRVAMSFLTIFNYDHVDITVSTQVFRHQRKAEVVMVLDNSGSMSGAKLESLKSSATTLIDTLFGDDTISDIVKIGLVPFTRAVNVGADQITSDWIDAAGSSALHIEDIDIHLLTGVPSLFHLFGEMTNVSWAGCVRARTGGHDITDAPPDPASPDTLFAPYFYPDGPDSPPTFPNYLVDEGPTPTPEGSYPLTDLTTTGRWRYAGKYIGTEPTGRSSPNTGCPEAEVQPLTNDKTVITSAINAMVANGNTVIPQGLVWGWRTISPGTPFEDGAPYSDESVIKVVILLTDGDNAVSNFSSYGFLASGHLDSPTTANPNQVLNEKLTALCGAIKADQDGVAEDADIILYTISFGNPNQTTRDMLEECATPPEHCPSTQCYFHSPTTTALQNVFSSIALGINELRIAQ